MDEKNYLFLDDKYLVFGSKTEKNPSKNKDEDKDKDKDTNKDDGSSSNATSSEHKSGPEPKSKKKRKGGRHSHDDYSGAERSRLDHELYSVGDNCPCCAGKKLRAVEPGSVLILKGQGPHWGRSGKFSKTYL